MSTAATSPDRTVVSATIAQQPAPKQPPRWWDGLTLDQQDDWLNRIDPEQYGPGQVMPMPVGRWNREKRRVRRARERWIEEIRALRRPCHCKNCRRHNRPPFPPYYVVSLISYECWLEEQTVDPELEKELEALRNDRRRVGSAYSGRTSEFIDRWNIPYQ
jgi:hypothetical protein